MLNFDQVFQITHNVDYSYALNKESLVFAHRSSSDSTSDFDPSINNMKFTFKCIFLCILKEQIIFPLMFSNSNTSSDSLLNQNDNDDTKQNDQLFTTALGITNDSSTVIIGRNDGSIVIVNLKQFLDARLQVDKETDNNDKNPDNSNLQNQFELPVNNYTHYKFIHKNEIANIAFLKGDKRAIIGDTTGMITLLSFVNSFTCELVVQTTIINLKMPYYIFEVFSEENIFAFASSKGFSVLKAGRRIEVLLCSEDEKINPEICCSIEKFPDNQLEYNNLSNNNSKIRILICQNRSVFVYDIDIEENRKISQWSFDLPLISNNGVSQSSSSIIKCFIIKHSYFLLILKDGNAVIVKDKNCEIVSVISDLPTNPNPTRIQLYENELIYFLKSDIVQKIFDFPPQ